MRRSIALAALALTLAGCAMTPEQQQAMGDAMQRFGHDLQNQPTPQRRTWTPEAPGNVPQQQPATIICHQETPTFQQPQVICTQQPAP